jgi:predicted enzyme related to lactoylglutathione lyase
MAGELVWFELPAEDTERARGFYRDLFGWDFQAWEGPFEYHLIHPTGERSTPRRRARTARSSTSAWTTSTPPSSASASSAARPEEKQEIPSIGVFAHSRDTEGNSFNVFQGAA